MNLTTQSTKGQSGLTSTLATRINAEHEACMASASEALDHALECGELLGQVKSQCRHGEWGPWLKANFLGSNRTARAYMRIARHREIIEVKRQSAADLTLERALKYLAPRLPKPPCPTELSVHEQKIEDGLAAWVLSFDAMGKIANLTGRTHEEIWHERGNGDNFAEQKRNVANWRSTSWFQSAAERIRGDAA